MRNILLTTILSISIFFVTGNAWSETINYSNGAKYVGQVKNGLRHGKGTVTFTGGEKYVSYNYLMLKKSF